MSTETGATTSRVVVSNTERHIDHDRLEAYGLPRPSRIRRSRTGVVLEYNRVLTFDERAEVTRYARLTEDTPGLDEDPAVIVLDQSADYLATVPDPDADALQSYRDTMDAFLSATPPDIPALVDQVETITRYLLADRSSTSQVRRLTRLVARLARINVRPRPTGTPGKRGR